MTAAVFGLVGVIVGGILNGVVSWQVQRIETRAGARAIARLAYDDFLHLQSTLVRALADDHWWDASHLLEQQLGSDDWKLLLGTLRDEPSQDVALARGWMNYLISRWHTVAAPAPIAVGLPMAPPALAAADVWLMRDTFCRLERARRQLSKLSGRSFSSFKDGGVLATLAVPRTLEQLGIDAERCRDRRKAGYGRAQS